MELKKTSEEDEDLKIRKRMLMTMMELNVVLWCVCIMNFFVYYCVSTA